MILLLGTGLSFLLLFTEGLIVQIEFRFPKVALFPNASSRRDILFVLGHLVGIAVLMGTLTGVPS